MTKRGFRPSKGRRVVVILAVATLGLSLIVALPVDPVAAAPGAPAAVGTTSGPALAGAVGGTVTNGVAGLGAIDVRAYDVASGVAVAKTATTGDGTYVLDHVPPGHYAVRFSDATAIWATEWFDGASTLATATPITVADGTAATADVALVANPTHLAGHVTGSENGAPLPGIDVRVEDLATNHLAAKTRTGAGGEYAFGQLPVGAYRVRFSDPAGFRRMQWFPAAPNGPAATPVVVAASTPVVADAALEPAGTIIAYASTPAGPASAPVPGIDVRVYDAPTGAFLGKATTDADGEAIIPGLSVAPYDRADVKVRFSDPTGTYALQWYLGASTQAAATPLRISSRGNYGAPVYLVPMAGLGAIGGRITDGTDGLAGVGVRAYPVGSFTRAAKVTTAADGSYTIAGLAPGDYRISAGDADGPWVPEWYPESPAIDGATPVTVAGGGTAVANLTLSPAAPLSLVVDAGIDAPDAVPGDRSCDDGASHCTMRAAVDEANANPAADTISIAAGVNPTLTLAGAAEDGDATGDLDIRGVLTIHGGGATLDANQLDRGIHSLEGTLTIDHLTVTNGTTAGDRVGGDGDDGGAILAMSALTMSDSAVTNSHAVRYRVGGGGGIRARGPLTLVDSVVTGNVAESSGGGVFATGSSTTITRTTISGNESHVRVPDIHRDESSAALNVGSLAGPAGPVAITDSTISGNASLLNDQARSGGGMNIYAPTLLLRNTTVAANSANVYPGLGFGGVGGSVGVAMTGGPATFLADTITDNTGWPGIYQVLMADGTGPITMRGTILAGPFPVCAGPNISLGFNIWSDTNCDPGLPTDRSATDALLGPLANNGGPTRTRLPGATSPAIDAIPLGTPGLCDATLPTDQRGVARPRGGACDIGAVER